MMSIAQIAKRDCVSRAAVSRKVKQLTARQDLMVERDERGRVAFVNVAEYDHLRNRFDDPSKAQAPGRIRSTRADESYEEAIRLKTWAEAERARLNLEEKKDNLIRRDEVKDSIEKLGLVIVRLADAIASAANAEKVGTAFISGGVRGAQIVLKEIKNLYRRSVSDAVNQINERGKFDLPDGEADD
jgi:hypothetical protein